MLPQLCNLHCPKVHFLKKKIDILEGEETHQVVQGRHVHVEELVVRVVVQDREVLVHKEVLVELDVVQLDLVHVSVEARVQRDDGVKEVGGSLLVEHRNETRSTHHVERHDRLSSDGVGCELTVLGDDTLHVSGHSLHRLVLCGRSDTRHGETDVHGGPLSSGEELGVKVDLSVSDGDDVGHNVRGHVVGEGLNDGQGGQGPSSHTGGHHGGTLEQTRVQVENVTGVGLTTRGTTQKQRQLTVRHGLLGQIVVHNQGVTSCVTELLADGHSGEGCKVLQTGGVGSSRRHDDGVLECVVQTEQTVDTRNVGATLSDRHVHGHNVVLTQGLLVDADLVDHGRHGDRGLSGLTISDNQLTLSTTNGDHGVDNLESGGHVVVDRLTLDDVGCGHVHLSNLLLEEGAGAVDGAGGDHVAQGVDDLAEHSESDGDLEELLGGVDGLAGTHGVGVVKQDDTDGSVLVQVEDDCVRNTLLGFLRGLDLHDGVERRRATHTCGGDGCDGSVNAVHVAHKGGGLEAVRSGRRPTLLEGGGSDGCCLVDSREHGGCRPACTGSGCNACGPAHCKFS